MSNLQDQDLFPRFKKDVTCLSAWAISKLARRPVIEDEREEPSTHLATCAICANRLAEERSAVLSAQYEPMPAFIVAAQPKHRTGRWTWWGLGSLAIATAAALLFFVIPLGESNVASPQNETRMKGTFPVVVTVMREGQLVANDIPLEEAVVRTSDRLRLQVSSGETSWVIVEGFNEGWEQYYAGTNPQDWLPIAIEVTELGKTRLRVQVCPSDPSGINFELTACEYQIFDL